MLAPGGHARARGRAGRRLLRPRPPRAASRRGLRCTCHGAFYIGRRCRHGGAHGGVPLHAHASSSTDFRWSSTGRAQAVLVSSRADHPGCAGAEATAETLEDGSDLLELPPLSPCCARATSASPETARAAGRDRDPRRGHRPARGPHHHQLGALEIICVGSRAWWAWRRRRAAAHPRADEAEAHRLPPWARDPDARFLETLLEARRDELSLMTTRRAVRCARRGRTLCGMTQPASPAFNRARPARARRGRVQREPRVSQE